MLVPFVAVVVVVVVVIEKLVSRVLQLKAVFFRPVSGQVKVIDSIHVVRNKHIFSVFSCNFSDQIRTSRDFA